MDAINECWIVELNWNTYWLDTCQVKHTRFYRVNLWVMLNLLHADWLPISIRQYYIPRNNVQKLQHHLVFEAAAAASSAHAAIDTRYPLLAFQLITTHEIFVHIADLDNMSREFSKICQDSVPSNPNKNFAHTEKRGYDYTRSIHCQLLSAACNAVSSSHHKIFRTAQIVSNVFI